MYRELITLYNYLKDITNRTEREQNLLEQAELFIVYYLYNDTNNYTDKIIREFLQGVKIK